MNIRLITLKKQGALSSGDTLEMSRIGICTVVAIPTLHSLTVKNREGRYFTVSGLHFPGARFTAP